MVLDFDGVDIGRKEEIASAPHAVLTFVSPSGNGLKTVIRVEADKTTHAASFEAARVYYRERYGLDLDPSGKDLARLCFTSYDPTAVVNHKAEVLHRPHMTIETIHDNGDNTCDMQTPPADRKREADAPILYSLCNIEEVIRATQPTRFGQRHQKIFDLARGLRFDCRLGDKELKDLKPIVKRWHDMALPNIDTKEFTETWSDFVHAWTRAKTPLSEGGLATAWKRAQEGTPPPDCAMYDNATVQKLVALCWNLGSVSGTFYLSMHTAAKLLKVQAMTIQRWLKMMLADGLIEVIKAGTKKAATTYAWKGTRQ